MSEQSEANRRSPKKQALGRGLGSLLGDAAMQEAHGAPGITARSAAMRDGFLERASGDQPQEEAQDRALDQSRIWQIDIDRLEPNQRQPRKTFAPERLAELSQSIKEKGILQPIVARPMGAGKFEIIAGERRWRAAQGAGLHAVPVILKISHDQEALELALIENIQRENLNPIEEAEAYQHLAKTYGLTQQQLADRLGKDRATIANTLRLLALGKETRALLANNQISMGHAKVLLAVADHLQQKLLADRVVAKKLSVRELERQVANALRPVEQGARGDHLNLDMAQKFMSGLAEEMQKVVGTRVAIDYDKGKGKIAFHFYSDDQLNGIVERIREAWRKQK